MIELLEDQLAAERRVRELERQLEQRNNPPQQAMPVNGAGSHGNAGRANGVCGVFWDYGTSAYDQRRVSIPHRGREEAKSS